MYKGNIKGAIMAVAILPNWHPLFVHFTVALVTVSAIFFVLSKTVSSKSNAFELVAKWTLWTGAGFTILTVLAGMDAFGSVAHDSAGHSVMKTHRFWALITASAIVIWAVWQVRTKTVSAPTIAGSLILVGLVGFTGYLGSELVYRHGIGVLPVSQKTGEGHQHKEDDRPIAADQERAVKGAENNSLLDKELSPDFVVVSDALYVALRSGDAAGVSKLLADDVLILEGGQAQTSKAEYMGGHMLLDMAFLKKMNSKQVSRETGQTGDLAWVITHTEVTGIYKGKPVDTTSREFLQLRRIDGEWKITLVQWGVN